MVTDKFDVVVLGSGPAGSTASTILAQQGHRVLMIERERHPRFHIGESLLPSSAPIFERLGIQWDDKEYLPKNGAEFIDERIDQRVRFPLATQNQPYQVERAKFDLMMAENAVRQGVELRQEETVKSAEFDDNNVRITTDKGTHNTRYFIDASGRSAFMGRSTGSIKRIPNLGRYALYTHYRKASSKAAHKLYQTGDVKILMLDIGWFWVIPLTNQRMSVGIVVQKDPAVALKGEALYEHYRQASKTLSEVLDGAERETEVRAEADFSFTNQQRYGKRFACCGDASGFLDPVFSSGVFLAVTSAEQVADRVHQGLKSNTEDDPELHAGDDERYLLGFQSMQLFVERFYQNDMVHHLFFAAERRQDLQTDIASLLAGDLWSGDNSFQKALLDSRQAHRIISSADSPLGKVTERTD